MHRKTETENNVELESVGVYFLKVINKLCKQFIISDDDRRAYVKLMDRWLNRSLLQEARNVIVHGDATPTNFIFTKKGDVVAIDIERMRNCDPAFDVGMVCGELKHAFLWRTGNPYVAEPFSEKNAVNIMVFSQTNVSSITLN